MFQTDVYSEIDCIIVNEASCDAIQLPTFHDNVIINKVIELLPKQMQIINLPNLKSSYYDSYNIQHGWTDGQDHS